MSHPPELVLASTSPHRRALLQRLGLAFDCLAPGVDEQAHKSAGHTPRELAELLARAKAEAVARLRPHAIVIGSDQVCALGDTIFDKPGSVDRARQTLAAMAGRTHELITAVCVVGGGAPWQYVDVARLTMRALDDESIARYVDADLPLDCAGAYKLEQRGIALFERIECQDHTAIIGLPMIALCGELARRGIEVIAPRKPAGTRGHDPSGLSRRSD